MNTQKNNIELPDTIDFSQARILVIGDVMLDRYWHGDTSRISPEAPVPVVKIDRDEDRLGGAANVACNIQKLGAQAKLIGVIGHDEPGKKLKGLLEKHGVRADLFEADVQTCTKLRIIGRSQQLIRCDFEQAFDVYQHDVLALAKKHIQWATAVVLSDYAKGTLSNIEALIEIANQAKVPVLVDPKSSNFEKYSNVSMITPNFKEFKQVAGAVSSDAQIETKAKELINNYQFSSVLVTRGAQGMSLFEKDVEPYHVPALAREVFDITGAGDTVIAALSCALGTGFSKQHAAFLANVAAGIVVAKLGTAMVSIDELNTGLNSCSPMRSAHRKIVDLHGLEIARARAKDNGRKIVFTNGCFDILHAGHVTYLAKARSFGDGLIVAVNTDQSVRALKGIYRPIHALAERMRVLAALDCVDWVIPFSDETPLALIEKICPDILVKGADYQIHEIAGSDFVIANGGQVKLVDLVSGCSTTGTVNKIQKESESVGA